MATKREELSNLTGCLAKAADDEPIFILRAQDRSAPGTVRDWCQRVKNSGKTPAALIEEANDCAIAMDKWQREHPDKVKWPD